MLAQGEKQAGQGQLSPLRNVYLSWENPTARTDGITSMSTQRLEVIQCSLCTNDFAYSSSVLIVYLSSSRQHYKKHIFKTQLSKIEVILWRKLEGIGLI